MITLPVTTQMYHQLVQQQMQGNENTVCVTPMQVQNLISSNNLCGSVSNSNFNPSTTYIMSTSNRNVINFPFQGTAVGHIKSVISNHQSINQKLASSTQTRSHVKKSLFKKKVLNLTMAKATKESLKIEIKKNLSNNNSIEVKNRNSESISSTTQVIEKCLKSAGDTPHKSQTNDEKSLAINLKKDSTE
jgi:hypothetical protein